MNAEKEEIKLFENTALLGILMGGAVVLIAIAYVFFAGTAGGTKIVKDLTSREISFLPRRKTQAAVELRFAPEQEEFFVGDTFRVPVEILAADVDVAGLDIGISYPVELVSFVEVEKGPDFDQVLKEVSAEDGEIYISALVAPTKVFKGTETLATIVFEARAAGKGKLSFLKREGELVAPAEPNAEFKTSFSDFSFEAKEATQAAQPSL